MKLLLLLWPALLVAQSNLDLHDGVAGQEPPGWLLLNPVREAVYTAEWRKEGCRADVPCAVLTSPSSPTRDASGSLLQTFDAASYRGKVVRLRAWVRVDPVSPDCRAQMLLHVSRPNSQTGFVNNMADNPITSKEWKGYEIWGEVAPDAESIRVGVVLHGEGRAWISSIQFAAADPAESEAERTSVQAAIQKQYVRMDIAFARSDAAGIAAVLLPDAQLRLGTIREPLLEAIQGELRQGRQMTAKSTVRTTHLVGSDAIVIVERDALDPTSGGTRHIITVHRDTWTKNEAAWQLGESAELSYHWVLPPTTAEAARPVIAELKKAVPVTEQLEYLAAFGKAVGDARIVLLGESARGTREFAELKTRLTDYLVREKGFSVLAAANPADVPKSPPFALLDTASPRAAADSILRAAANAKVVVWTDSSQVRGAVALLKGRSPKNVHAVALLFRRGEVRAVGVQDGDSKGLGIWNAPPSPEGTGDAVFSAAGIPRFFLDLTALSLGGALTHWLGQPRLFHELSAYWVIDDPDASLQPLELLKDYDSVFFVEQTRALAVQN